MRRKYTPAQVEAAFWVKVDRPSPDACWTWTASLDRRGYGQFRALGKAVKPHRFAWELLVGPIPDGAEVCHDCPGGDNPACVNPAHLFIGTHQDNMRDMVYKGRARKGRHGPEIPVITGHHNAGSQNGSAKLDEAAVREIRRRSASGPVVITDLAVEFGVSQPTISAVLSRQSWKHVE